MSETRFHQVETLLDAPYWLIDIFPERISKEQAEVYFRTEAYYQKAENRERIIRAFLDFLIRLNCYYPFVILDAETEECLADFSPQELTDRFRQALMTDKKEAGCLYFLMEKENAMIGFEGDDLFMTLYHPDPKLLDMCQRLTYGCGLFVWENRE